MLDPILIDFFWHFIGAERSHMNVETEPRTYRYRGRGEQIKHFGGWLVGGWQKFLGVAWQNILEVRC